MAAGGSGATKIATGRAVTGASKYWRYKYVGKRGSESEIPPPFGTVDPAPTVVNIYPTTTITTTTITPVQAAVTVEKVAEATQPVTTPVETQVITATTVTTTMPPSPQIPAVIPPLQIWMDQFKILSAQLVPSANSSNAPAADSQRSKDQLDAWQYNYGDRLLAAAKARSNNSI